MTDFIVSRRQEYLDESVYRNSLNDRIENIREDLNALDHPEQTPENYVRLLGMVANAKRKNMLSQYTAGRPVHEFRDGLEEVVQSYELFIEKYRDLEGDDSETYFALGDRDHWVSFLSLLCPAILLHREDLIPRIHGLIKDSDNDESDAIIEELLGHYLPDRPKMDEWYFESPYEHLLDVIDDDTGKSRVSNMKKFLKSWYKSMKEAAFYGSHLIVQQGLTSYVGYWAFEAAAIAYLYDIDDTEFRDHQLYPKDLADFARSLPKRTPVEAAQEFGKRLRCEAGKPCPNEGWWWTPAALGGEEGRRYFREGELMPKVESGYGDTIWQKEG